jgi:Spy/CpxP family protein refolding chaperone
MISKNLMKQLVVAAGFLALTFAPGMTRAQSGSSQAPAQAQDQSQAAPAQPQARKHGAMAGVNLTDDQKAQIKKIHEDTKAQVEAVNKDESLTADQRQAKIHQLRHSARLQVVKLLTPEQRKRMRENIREMRAARREQQQQQAPPAQPQG